VDQWQNERTIILTREFNQDKNTNWHYLINQPSQGSLQLVVGDKFVNYVIRLQYIVTKILLNFSKEVIQSLPLFLFLIPVIDLQRNQDPNHHQQNFPDGIQQVLTELIIS
jgi:hypothetical protein